MELLIKELPVSENNYKETMTKTVEPYLNNYLQDGFFKSFDGNSIYYKKYIIEDALANVVIVHGFTESSEKFNEMIFCFMRMKFNVFIIDQRGHGKSFRLSEDYMTVSVKKFHDYVDDLDCFINNIVIPNSENKDLYVYCHSMGGAVAIQYLQEHPLVFSKAVLSAPMVKCQCNGVPSFAAKILADIFCLAGKKNDRVFVYKDFNPVRSYENSHDTSKERFEFYHEKRVNNKEYQTSSASYNWVKESIKITKKNLKKNRCKNITVPVLLCQPEEDTSVYSEKEDEFIKMIPNGRLIQFKKCKHEIYLSVDETLFEYLKEIESFLKID